jgi:hypothetical protein
MLNKKNYTIEDLLADDSFLKWFYRPDCHEIGRWNDWVNASPENRLLANKAAGMLAYIRMGYEKERTEQEIRVEVDRLIKIIRKMKNYIMSY